MSDDEFAEDDEPSEPDLEAEIGEEDDEFASPGIDDEDILVEDSAEVHDDEVEDEEDEVLDLEEELHPDDVEEPLDVLLQERTAAATLEDDEEEAEEEEPDVDERGDGPTRILPRRPGEFLCASCFLVLPRSQLADAKRMLCRDCA